MKETEAEETTTTATKTASILPSGQAKSSGEMSVVAKVVYRTARPDTPFGQGGFYADSILSTPPVQLLFVRNVDIFWFVFSFVEEAKQEALDLHFQLSCLGSYHRPVLQSHLQPQ